MNALCADVCIFGEIIMMQQVFGQFLDLISNHPRIAVPIDIFATDISFVTIRSYIGRSYPKTTPVIRRIAKSQITSGIPRPYCKNTFIIVRGWEDSISREN